MFGALVCLLVALMLVPLLRSRNAIIYSQSSIDIGDLRALGAQPGWQLIELETAADIALPGLIRAATSNVEPWVLFIPGNGSDQLVSGFDYLRQLAHGHDGWGLAVWPFRGSDTAPGTPSKDALLHDLRAIYGYLRSQYQVASNRLHIVGFSFGSDLTVLLTTELAQQGDQIASLVLLATHGNPVLSWKMRVSGWHRRWLPVDYYDLGPALEHIRAPVLMIEGELALRGTPGFFLERFGGPRAYVEIAGGKHAAPLSTEAVAVVRDWIVEQNAKSR